MQQFTNNTANHRLTSILRHLTANHSTQNPLLSSVVKIHTTSVAPSYQSPWQRQKEQKSTGTGFAIDLTNILSTPLPNGIPSIVLMTNNHVIRNATTVRVGRNGLPGKFIAKILAASPECDLAIISVENTDFWEFISPLQFAFDLHNTKDGDALPELGNAVTAVGYPMGGENISITKGVVSRIDLMDYTSQAPSGKLLVVQIDAAINPGNSGGPVTNQNKECIGVAFAGITRGNSIGYIIPLPIVRMFVLNVFDYLSSNKKHAKDTFIRLSSLGLGLQNTEAPPLRRHYKLNNTNAVDQRLGMLVLRVSTSSPCSITNKIQEGDIITSIAGHQVSEDGTVEVRSGSRVSLLYSVCMKRPGEKFEIEYVRQGKSATVSIIAAPVPRLVPRIHGVDASPSYLIVGGLVFTALTMPWIRGAAGSMGQSTVANILSHAEADLEYEGQQIVVLAKVLSHDVNFGYESFSGQILTKLGETQIKSLKHLNSLLTTNNTSPFSFEENELLSFTFESNRKILLDRNQCEKAQAEILERQSIPKSFML